MTNGSLMIMRYNNSINKLFGNSTTSFSLLSMNLVRISLDLLDFAVQSQRRLCTYSQRPSSLTSKTSKFERVHEMPKTKINHEINAWKIKINITGERKISPNKEVLYFFHFICYYKMSTEKWAFHWIFKFSNWFMRVENKRFHILELCNIRKVIVEKWKNFELLRGTVFNRK